MLFRSSLVDSGVNIIHQMLLNLLMVMDLVLACTASFLCVLVLSLGDSSEYSECYPPNDECYPPNDVESFEYFTLFS